MQKEPENAQPQSPEEVYYPSFMFKTDNLYVPKPEWYFLFLYQLLKYFPGRLEAIATVVVTAGGILGLLLLPFIDKSSEKRPRKRPIAMTGLFFAVLGIVLLTIIGLAS
jgi:quinol-cytochrome oxidoreductase complex cytochrome b subunit